MSGRYLFGEWKDPSSRLDLAVVSSICEEAEKRVAAIADYPVESTLALLERARRLWSSPQYERRLRCLELLPAEMGLSGPMVTLGLDRLCDLLNPEPLRAKIAAELRGLPRRAGVHYDESASAGLHWQPLGILFHVLAGNGFLGAAGSLIEGLITGNVNLLKMSSGRKTFLPELVGSLLECDEDRVVSGSIALLDFSSSQTEIIEELKTRVDGIVVWGGEQAVRAYRDGLPARTRIIVFGPKLSLAMVTRSAVDSLGGEAIAESLAREITLWDQTACTAPQLCYVQGETNAIQVLEQTGKALSQLALTLPPGTADDNTAVEIQKLRGLSEIAEARGEGRCLTSRSEVDWTLVLSRSLDVEASPLHRTLRIIPYGEPSEVLRALQPMKGYLQTIGIAASSAEQIDLSTQLSRLGATRLVDLGKMASGDARDPHDGAYDLPQLMNLAMTRFTPRSRDLHPIDCVSTEHRTRLLDERLGVLLARARESAFYADRLKGLAIDGVSDLPKIPVLSRSEMEAQLPPRGTGLGTGTSYGGYVSRSGGSTTGDSTFSVYDQADWDNLVGSAVRIFRALGLERGDRLANCMRAGDLYGGFVSFDHVNNRLGVTNFAFATAITPEALIDVWRKFNINVVQGIPAMIIPLLRAAKDLEPTFHLPKIVYAGAPLSRTDEEWLKSALGANRIASVVGANDGGQIAYQCIEMRGPLHHTIDDYNYIEVVDDFGQPVPEGKMGKVLITSLLKHAYPLIRYEIGDVGRIVPGDCPCGRTTRRLEYLGRTHDKIALGPITATLHDFRSAVDHLPLCEIQLVARRNASGEALILRAETTAPSDSLDGQIRESLLASIAGLTADLLQVELYSPGRLPRNPRSIKLKAFIDERN